MNKYLEKIAELHDLEDGVQYDTKTHGLKISKARTGQELDRKDRNRRLLYGASGLPSGALAGTAISIGLDTEARQQGGRPFIKTLANKVLRGRATSILPALGAATMGGIAYAFNGTPSYERAGIKDKLVGKLEKRHGNAINKLEGWGDV